MPRVGKTGGILHEALASWRGESTIFVIPERRILVYVAAMITGIILVMRHDAASQLLAAIGSRSFCIAARCPMPANWQVAEMRTSGKVMFPIQVTAARQRGR
jgi:hypothetical protein